MGNAWRTLPYSICTVSIAGSGATVGGLSNDATYYHRVRAVNGSEYSNWTPYVTTTLASASGYPTNQEEAEATPPPPGENSGAGSG